MGGVTDLVQPPSCRQVTPPSFFLLRMDISPFPCWVGERSLGGTAAWAFAERVIRFVPFFFLEDAFGASGQLGERCVVKGSLSFGFLNHSSTSNGFDLFASVVAARAQAVSRVERRSEQRSEVVGMSSEELSGFACGDRSRWLCVHVAQVGRHVWKATAVHQEYETILAVHREVRVDDEVFDLFLASAPVPISDAFQGSTEEALYGRYLCRLPRGADQRNQHLQE